MISKKFKVSREKIKYLLEKGAEMRSGLFIVRYEKNNEQFPGFCVIISRKMDKSAVKRNRLKRQIFEGIRLILAESENRGAIDLVLIPKKIILGKDFEEITNDLKHIFKKLKL